MSTPDLNPPPAPDPEEEKVEEEEGEKYQGGDIPRVEPPPEEQGK